MKHAVFQDMTFSALSKRADEVKVVGSYSDFVVEQPGDPAREVAVFLEHEQIGWHEGWKTTGKEVIAVALCDLDDPQADIEILGRDQAVALFGWQWVEDRECME